MRTVRYVVVCHDLRERRDLPVGIYPTLRAAMRAAFGVPLWAWAQWDSLRGGRWVAYWGTGFYAITRW